MGWVPDQMLGSGLGPTNRKRLGQGGGGLIGVWKSEVAREPGGCVLVLITRVYRITLRTLHAGGRGHARLSRNGATCVWRTVVPETTAIGQSSVLTLLMRSPLGLDPKLAAESENDLKSSTLVREGRRTPRSADPQDHARVDRSALVARPGSNNWVSRGCAIRSAAVCLTRVP